MDIFKTDIEEKSIIQRKIHKRWIELTQYIQIFNRIGKG